MSRGSPIIGVRVTPLIRSLVDAAVASSKKHETKKRPAHTITTFINSAIMEKLGHLKRSNRRKKKTKSQPGDNPVA